MDNENFDQLAEATRKALDTLNPLEAAILRQSFGIEYEKIQNDGEIARALDIPAAFVEVYRVRALRKLRHPARSMLFNELMEWEATPKKHVEIVIPKAIEEIEKLTPQLLERLHANTDNIEKLQPDVFEHFVAELLASRGFKNVRLIGREKKTSADIFATKYVDDVGEHKYFVEVKRWKDRIGVEVIDRVYGAMIAENSRYGWTAAMIVSIVGFKNFRKYTRDDIHNLGIYLKNRDDLLFWLDEYKINENGLLVPVENARNI